MKKSKLPALVLLAITLCIPHLSAQKKKGKANPKVKVEAKANDIKPILSTFSDSLSYALGADMQSGLKSYMLETGALIDTSTIISEYDTRIYNALSEDESSKIRYELKLKLDSANEINSWNTTLFMKGFTEAMQVNSADAYEAGRTMGNLIKATSDSYKTQFSEIGGINQEILIEAINRGMVDQEPIIETTVYDMMEIWKNKNTQVIDQENIDKVTESESFFANNALQEGIITTETGLQYKIIKKGNGRIPDLSDRVTVNYEGRYIDGTVFDSTEKHGQSARFVAGQVVEGFSQALTQMPEGSKWTVYIPYNLGYGEKQVGTIKPYSTLIFDIELIKVEKDEE